MSINENLNDTFNLGHPIVSDVISAGGELIVPHGRVEENVESDYERTRTNLHNLLEQGQQALISALEVARASEHPRAFEVVGNLVKQLADVNHQLLDLSDKRQKLMSKKEELPGNQITNNNAFFVGSTTELNKMIRDMTGGT